MRLLDHGDSITIQVSASNTEAWALGHFGGGRWPCSDLSGKRFSATFDTTGIVSLSVNGRNPVNLDYNELNACIADLLKGKLPKDHPCYYVVVGQFT